MQDKKLYRAVPLEVPNIIIFNLQVLEPISFNDLFKSVRVSCTKSTFEKWVRWLIKEKLIQTEKEGKQKILLYLGVSMKKTQKDIDQRCTQHRMAKL